MTLPTALVAIAICIALEGFFSGSEMAMVSADRLKLRQRAAEGRHGAVLVLRMLERPERVLGTCLIGTNLCVVTAATIATHQAASQETLEPALLASLLLTPVVLILAEMVPKSIYQFHADLLAPIVARPLLWISWLFTPGLWIVQALDRLLRRIVPASEGVGDQPVSREEIRLLVDSEERGTIDDDERQLIRKVLEFSDISVEEAMVPLIEVHAIPEHATVLEAARKMVATGYSRLPVFRGRIDDIIGVVVHRDLLFAEDLEAQVGSLLRKVPYVPESKPVEALFAEFQRDRERLAVVVDEYGGATGVISTEDILEEIVGEIEDEFDRDPIHIERVNDRQWVADGRAEVELIEAEVGLKLPEGDFETLAGFILSRTGRIPVVGTRIVWQGWRLTVSKATDRVIQEVTITRLEPGRP